jgi:hypothetical protein
VDVLVESHERENLELGQDIELISEVLGRSPSDVALGLIQLYQDGNLVVMAEATFDAFVKRIEE